MSLARTLTPAILITAALASQGAVSYTGGTYTQNFNTLPYTPENVTLQTTAAWTDDTAAPTSVQTSILGWYLYHPVTQTTEGGVNQHQRLRAGTGSASAGSFYSFGTASSSERALGGLGSSATAPTGTESYIGLRLHNDGTETLYKFTLSYNGEQWRDGGNATPVAQTMSFGWSTSATAIQDTTFTSVAELAFTSPVYTTVAAAVDGNAAGRSAITYTVTGIEWLPGTDLWLRWGDKNDTGNDHAMAIDDVSFVAMVPEPGTGALAILGFLAMGWFRRKA